LIEYDTREFRFLALERYTKNLQTVLDQNHNRLEENVVLTLCQQILHSLEYIHLKGYSHADIKGTNLMLKNENVYLVDFGLASNSKTSNSIRGDFNCSNFNVSLPIVTIDEC
jgi:serine/threonine protein kinase